MFYWTDFYQIKLLWKVISSFVKINKSIFRLIYSVPKINLQSSVNFFLNHPVYEKFLELFFTLIQFIIEQTWFEIFLHLWSVARSCIVMYRRASKSVQKVAKRWLGYIIDNHTGLKTWMVFFFKSMWYNYYIQYTRIWIFERDTGCPIKMGTKAR